MNFRDSQLKEYYDRTLGAAGDASEEMRQTRALMAAREFFQMLEGPHSAQVHEIVEHLLSPRIRSGLRWWYQRSDAETDSAALAFRDHLNRLTGERLEMSSSV
jgi:hypothetical protein